MKQITTGSEIVISIMTTRRIRNSTNRMDTTRRRRKSSNRMDTFLMVGRLGMKSSFSRIPDTTLSSIDMTIPDTFLVEMYSLDIKDSKDRMIEQTTEITEKREATEMITCLML